MPKHKSVPMTDAEKKEWTDALARMDDSFLPALAWQGEGAEHKRVYVVAFDGTWNDRDNVLDNERPTNVAQLESKLSALYDGDRIAGAYYAGVGTRTNSLNKLLEGMTGDGTEQRAERAFDDLQRQAQEWLKEDPNAQIHVFVTGFSRGAASARHFMNLVDDRGIPAGEAKLVDVRGPHSDDPSPNLVKSYDQFLRQPGQVTTSALLFDTVATGQENVVNLSIPPSARYVIHVTSQDENRSTFPLTATTGEAPFEAYEGHRFMNLSLPGVHSDIGGGYEKGVSQLGLYLAEQVVYKLGFNLNPGEPPLHALNEGRHQHHGLLLSSMDEKENIAGVSQFDRPTLHVNNEPMSEAERKNIAEDNKQSTIAAALRYVNSLENGTAPKDPNGFENYGLVLQVERDGLITVRLSDPDVMQYDEKSGQVSVYGHVVRTLTDKDYFQLTPGEPLIEVYSVMTERTNNLPSSVLEAIQHLQSQEDGRPTDDKVPETKASESAAMSM